MTTEHSILTEARLLASQGLRTGAVRLACRTGADSVVHADSRSACSRLDRAGVKSETLSLFSLLAGKHGSVCGECLEDNRFRDIGRGLTLDLVLGWHRHLLELLPEHEAGTRPMAAALELAKEVSRITDPVYCDGLLRADLQARLNQANARHEARRRGSDGLAYAKEVCATLVLPDPMRAIGRSEEVHARVTELTVAQRAATLTDPSWVLASVEGEHGSPSWISEPHVRREFLRLFVRDGILAVPGLVFQAVGEICTVRELVVVPEALAPEVLEAVVSLYEPDGTGPYARLSNALAAAQAL